MFKYARENAGQGMRIGWIDAYVYAADLCCEDCGRAIQKKLLAAGQADTEESDSFPQGPYPDGGGESDSPQHCSSGEGCANAMTFEGVQVGVWLGNPLTTDGVECLKEILANPNATPYQNALHEFWADVYADCLEASGEVDEAPCMREARRYTVNPERSSYTMPASRWKSPEGAYRAGYRDGLDGRPRRQGFVTWPGSYADGHDAGVKARTISPVQEVRAGREIKHELWLCQDCMFLAVNGDASGMSDEQAVKSERGLDQLTARVGWISANFDGDTGDGEMEFSRRDCDSCGTHLYGSRFRFASFGRNDVVKETRRHTVRDFEGTYEEWLAAARSNATGISDNSVSRRAFAKGVDPLEFVELYGGFALESSRMVRDFEGTYEEWLATARSNASGISDNSVSRRAFAKGVDPLEFVELYGGFALEGVMRFGRRRRR